MPRKDQAPSSGIQERLVAIVLGHAFRLVEGRVWVLEERAWRGSMRGGAQLEWGEAVRPWMIA